MEDKNFKTYDEQISFLKNEKQLLIQDEDRALKLLKQHSYFALINGYKYPFKNKAGEYKKNTTIEDIYLLYEFDNKLRHILVRNIMRVEIHIKSLLSYVFAETFGDKQTAYLVATNYNYQSPKYQADINKLIGVLTEICKESNKYGYMCHQRTQHGNIPLWVMVKALTLGNVSKMYSCQKPEIQTKISKEFPGCTEDDVAAFLDLLTRFRNVCAHNERLFDYRYNKGSINDTQMHKALNLPIKNGHYKKGKSDLFAVLISLKYLLIKEEFDKMIQEIFIEIEKLTEETAQIQREQLYKYMGFPNDWHKIKDISIQ